MLVLSFADLRYRSRQFAIAVIGSGLVFAMALVVQGLANGFRAEAGRTVAAVDADAFVVRTGTGGAFTGLGTFPQTVVDQVRAEPGVSDAAPLIIVPTVITSAGRQQNVHVIGYQPGKPGTPGLASGRTARGPQEIVVDGLTKIHTGATVTLGPRHFRVVGHTHGMSYQGGIPNIYLPLASAQDLVFGGRAQISAVAVSGHPRALPDGFAIETASQARSNMLRPLHNALTAIDNARMFLWVVAAVIIGTVVYLSTLERRRDFAVLKAIGFSGRRLFSGLTLQSTLIALAAAVVAVACYRLLAPIIPIPLSLPVTAFAVLPIVAVVVGLLASLAGIRQTISVDPALAFGAR